MTWAYALIWHAQWDKMTFISEKLSYPFQDYVWRMHLESEKSLVRIDQLYKR